MCIKYILHTEVIKGKNNNSFTLYGISAVNENKEILVTHSGIFCELEEAVEFVNLCNSEELELVHLADVIEDLFA